MVSAYLGGAYLGEYHPLEPAAPVVSGPAYGSYALEVNWNGDGVTWTDIAADVWDVDTFRGRDYHSHLTGQSSAGTLVATLKNTSGNYSSFNAAGAYTGNILPGRLVRFRSTGPTAAQLWMGYLDRLEPHAGYPPTATLYASGSISRLTSKQISPAPQLNVDTGALVRTILTAAGWTGAVSIDVGQVPIAVWFVQDKDALEAIQEAQETELGFFWEDAGGALVYESRYKRLTASASAVSQATFSDNGGAALDYSGIVQADPLREIFNEITADVLTYQQPGALAVLWTLQGTLPTLAPGASITYIAQYPNSSSGGAQSAYASSWTTPVIGTDITQQGVSNSDLAIVVTKTATKMFMTVTNNHATITAQLLLWQARGIPVSFNNPFQVQSVDATSQDKYGVRTFPLPSAWWPNEPYARAACDYFITRYKDPRPVLDLTIQAGKSSALFAQCVQRQISDRITFIGNQTWTKLGISRDFWIESISHSLKQGQALITTFNITAADTDPGYFILDTDVLDGAKVLAY